MNDTLIDENIRKALLRIKLPKFIWLCEIYKNDDLNLEKCSGIVILDSTGGNALASVILYILEDKYFITDGMDWVQYKQIAKFSKKTYKHNLKGEWNQWKN